MIRLTPDTLISRHETLNMKLCIKTLLASDKLTACIKQYSKVKIKMAQKWKPRLGNEQKIQSNMSSTWTLLSILVLYHYPYFCLKIQLQVNPHCTRQTMIKKKNCKDSTSIPIFHNHSYKKSDSSLWSKKIKDETKKSVCSLPLLNGCRNFKALISKDAYYCKRLTNAYGLPTK